LSFNFSLAHDINTASVVLTKQKEFWIVHISFARSAANYSIAEYSKISNDALKDEVFKKQLISYVKSHFKLSIDDEIISIGSGGIKLGNHQTDLRFIIPSFPKNYKTIKISIPLFKENKNQHTVVRLKDDQYEFRKILNHSNEFIFSVQKTNKGFIEDQSSNSEYYLIVLFGGLILLIWIGYNYYSKRS